MVRAQASLTSRLSTSNISLSTSTTSSAPASGLTLTEQPESRESHHSQGDAGSDDQHAVLVAQTVVQEAPDYPAGSVTNVGEYSNVGVETVRGHQELAVRLLPVDQKALGDTHGEKSKPDLNSTIG